MKKRPKMAVNFAGKPSCYISQIFDEPTHEPTSSNRLPFVTKIKQTGDIMPPQNHIKIKEEHHGTFIQRTSIDQDCPIYP